MSLGLVFVVLLLNSRTLFRVIGPVELCLLVLQVLGNRATVRIDQDQLFVGEDLGQDEHANRDAQLDDDRESNRDDLDRSEDDQSYVARNLDRREHVHASSIHVFGVGFCWELLGLHKEHEESLEKLVGLETGKTHEQKHSVQNRDRNDLEDIQHKERDENQNVDSQVCQSRLLDGHDLAAFGSLGQGVDMCQGSHSSSDQPWETNHRVHSNHTGNNDSVPVVSLSVRQLVVGVVDQMPRDTVIQKDENESQHGRDGGKERNPRLAVDSSEADQPAAATKGFDLWAVLGEGGQAIGRTADLCRSNRLGNVQSFHGDVGEQKVGHQAPNEDRNNDGEVSNRVTDSLVGKVRSELEATKLECQVGGSDTQNE